MAERVRVSLATNFLLHLIDTPLGFLYYLECAVPLLQETPFLIFNFGFLERHPALELLRVVLECSWSHLIICVKFLDPLLLTALMRLQLYFSLLKLSLEFFSFHNCQITFTLKLELLLKRITVEQI